MSQKVRKDVPLGVEEALPQSSQSMQRLRLLRQRRHWGAAQWLDAAGMRRRRMERKNHPCLVSRWSEAHGMEMGEGCHPHPGSPCGMRALQKAGRHRHALVPVRQEKAEP
mmetsp:Transcript_35870/g.90378  ORF Transcript_35870/g.90378 Transcript_35870/m.90378 type:complete len:110 (-) Transcript_35870:528-857(-)